jgi:hypothetical protein
MYNFLFFDKKPDSELKAEKPINCGGCGTQMIGKDYMGIRIDECPNCESVFLDREELDKIRDKVEEEVKEDIEHRTDGFSSGFILGMLL